MGYSQTEDCSQGRTLDYTQTPLIGEPTASRGQDLPVNFVTFRPGPSWQGKCITPSYVDIAFRPLLLNQQSRIPEAVNSSHRVVYTITDDDLPSQGSYLDYYGTALASATMPLIQKKFEHFAIEEFLDREDLGNPGLTPNYPESNERISRNISALDLSSTRTSLDRLLNETVQQNSLSDSHVLSEHRGANRTISEHRSRLPERRKNVFTLRRSSSQSASWHSVYKPRRCNNDGQFLRILLGQDSDWIHDPKRNISYLRTNISETEGATVTALTSESLEGETILQDCQAQSTKIGYLEQFVNLASQFFLGWKTEDKQIEEASFSQGNISVTAEESSSCETSHATSSDTENSEMNSHTTFSESQKSEPDHSLSEKVESLKENIQVAAARTNVFQMLKRQFEGWTMSRVTPQEKCPHLYDIDTGKKTLFASNRELTLAINNAASSYLKEFEQSNEINNGKFYNNERAQGVNHEQNGEYEPLISQLFKTGKLYTDETCEGKEERVVIQDNARKCGTGERRSRSDTPLLSLKPGGKRSSRIEMKDNSRKQRHWYMRKGKLKGKALRVKDGVKSLYREGNGSEVVPEYYQGRDVVSGGQEEHDTSDGDYHDYCSPSAADDEEEEVEEEEYEQQQQLQQQQQQKQLLQQLLQRLQQQQYKQPVVRKDMSTQPVVRKDTSMNLISKSTTDSCSLPKLHECNVKRWRENLVTWRKKRQELLSSCISNVGNKTERTQARRSGKCSRDNTEKSIKSVFSKLDLESIEKDALENNAGKIERLNLIGEGNTLEELKTPRDHEGSTLKHEATLTLCSGDGRENFAACEKQGGECHKEREHYSNEADWKSRISELTNRESSFMRSKLKPQMSESKDSSNLLKEMEENERYRPSENVDRFHIARKSFFVNYQMYEDKWTERRGDKWFYEKYRSSEEEHKLLTTGQIGTADNVREKQKLLKDVLEKMDEVAGGDKNDEKVQEEVALDKWFSLLDALVKFNEKAEKDARVKDEQVLETSSTNRQDGNLQIGDSVHSDRNEIPELSKIKDFNLNKDVLNWIEEGESVGVKEGGDRKLLENKSTEVKHTERRFSHAEQEKSAFEEVSKPVQCSAEIRKNIVVADMKPCEANTKSYRNEYERSVCKKGKAEFQATGKVDGGIAERSQNAEHLRNTDKELKTGKCVVVNAVKNRVATCKSIMGNYEQKDTELESSDRSKTLRSIINGEIPHSEISNNDKRLAKIDSKCEGAIGNHQNDNREKDTASSLYGKDTSGQRNGSIMKLDFVSCLKENLDNFLSTYDQELAVRNDLETIYLISSVLKAKLDDETGGTLRDEMLINANAEENVGIQDTRQDMQESESMQIASQDIHESKRQQIPGQGMQESERQDIANQDIQESERQQIASQDIQESERQQILGQGVQESERQQIDLRMSTGAAESRSVDTSIDSIADDSVDRIPGADPKAKPDVSVCKTLVAPLKEPAVAFPEETPSQREALSTFSRLLFSAGIVESTHVSFLKQRLMEELEKFSQRNVPPIVEVPEMGSLMEPPQATPMFISRKSLDKVEEFLGFKISSWLAPGATTITEECSSSDKSLQLPQDVAEGPMTRSEARKNDTSPTETQSATESYVGPQLGKLVDNNRELTFYRPLLPIPAQYKCVCVDCCKNRRSGKPRPRRMRSRRTILSSEKFRRKTVRNGSLGTTYNQDAWANSDMERTSYVKPLNRIYSDRFFKSKISVDNILKLCKKLPEWHKPVAVTQITGPDYNEHEHLCIAKCLNAGDFENQPKDDDDRSSCSPEIQHSTHDTQGDADVEAELPWSESFNLPCGFSPNLPSVEPRYLSDSSCKSGSVHNHLYDTCRTTDYLNKARAYTRPSPYASPLSQLPVSPHRPYCNISSTGAFLDGRYTNNLYKNPKYTSPGHATGLSTYRPPLFRQPFFDYLSKNCYSHRKPMLCHDTRPCPAGLCPESCYSSPLLSNWGYSYHSRPGIPTSSPYTYRPLSPWRYTSTNYCSGCDATSSTSFKNCSGSLSFSIHNYV
ncbi:hypothetical protein BsWGS_25953 [Bradybaena similaris]